MLIQGVSRVVQRPGESQDPPVNRSIVGKMGPDFAGTAITPDRGLTLKGQIVGRRVDCRVAIGVAAHSARQP